MSVTCPKMSVYVRKWGNPLKSKPFGCCVFCDIASSKVITRCQNWFLVRILWHLVFWKSKIWVPKQYWKIWFFIADTVLRAFTIIFWNSEGETTSHLYWVLRKIGKMYSVWPKSLLFILVAKTAFSPQKYLITCFL